MALRGSSDGSRLVPAKILDGALHGDLVGIASFDDLEPHLLQRLAHEFGVVRGVAKWTARVSAIADNQSDAGLRRGQQRHEQKECEQAESAHGTRRAVRLGIIALYQRAKLIIAARGGFGSAP